MAKAAKEEKKEKAKKDKMEADRVKEEEQRVIKEVTRE